MTRAQRSRQSLARSRWCGMCGAGVFSQYLTPPNWCQMLARASGWCGAQCLLCSTWYLQGNARCCGTARRSLSVMEAIPSHLHQ